jgi:uncharacterized protein (DUF2252 family)
MKPGVVAELAQRQREADLRRCTRFPDLQSARAERLGASAFGFLRGSAPLYYEMLAREPEWATGPGGESWLCGDLHCENFGAFRVDALHVEAGDAGPEVVFDLNDFDDAYIGPCRLDVLRLTTSLLLAARGRGLDGAAATAMAQKLLLAYRMALAGEPAPTAPHVVTAHVKKVAERTRDQLLDARTEPHGDARRFQRGPRYRDLPPELVAPARDAFAQYVHGLPSEDRGHPEAFEVVDTALRIAGTGSLGCLRVAFLVRGKGGKHGYWIFDMKEEGDPSAAKLVAPPSMPPAERVCTAMRACLKHPPRMIGATTLATDSEKVSMLVRRLAPQEDKIAVAEVKLDDVELLASWYGATAGMAHRRSAQGPLPDWSASDTAVILAHAVELAGLHEAVYLAYSTK